MARKGTTGKSAKKRTTTKAPRSEERVEEPDEVEQALSVDSLLARAGELAAEREAQAASERGSVRAVRPRVEPRPSYAVHWGYAYCFDAALEKEERATLEGFFARFTTVREQPGHGFFVVAAETDVETRRAAWAADAIVIEVEQLRAQLPSADEAARRERLERALARPSSEGWAEVVMLLSTWDAATLGGALHEAERRLTSWPDELRTTVAPWGDRPELLRLVRVHWGPLDAAPAAEITVVRTQDAKELVRHQAALSGLRVLDVSGAVGLPDVVARCTALGGLERLVLQQPTYSKGTAAIHLGKLLAAPHLQRLGGLSLYGYKLAARDLAALAECAQPLEHLRIQYASMKPPAARALARLASRRSLRSLDLKYNDLGPEGASELFAAPEDWRALRVLDVSANEIGDEGARALAQASLVELRWLNLSSNAPEHQLGPAAARALAESAALGRLETLILHGHPIGAEGLAALLYSPCLRELRRLNAGFADTSLAALMKELGPGEPVPLTELHLGNLESSSPWRLDLRPAEFLRTVRLLSLDALDGEEYAEVLACPHLGALEVLVLGGGYANPDAAFKALCSAGPPPRLRYLGLNGWRFTAEQAREFAASPLGRQLWGLDLMTSYTVPDAWYEFYCAGLPLLGSPFYDAYAPSEHTTTTTFREEI